MIDEKLLEVIKDYRLNPDDARLERAVRELGSFLYGGLKRFKIDVQSDDSRSDFIAWIYPRLPGIIRHFDEERASFNTYITWVVRLSWRTFWRNQYSRDACQRVLETEAFTTLLSVEADRANANEWNSCTADTGRTYARKPLVPPLAPRSGTGSKAARERRRKPARSESLPSAKKREIEARKVFLLACKAGNFLDEAAIGKIARLTGYDEAYIRSTVAIIQDRCKVKRERMQAIREQQNATYIRAQKNLFEMKYLDRDSSRYLALEKEYRYCVKRLERLRTQSLRQIRSPSNRFLAATLGMSRGTVDATLASALQGEYPERS
jgi:hypothetical protein